MWQARQGSEARDGSVPRRLTARQAQVLQLLVWDSPAQKIARELGISVRTVEGHLAAMRRHAGCATLAGLAAWAVATRAVAPPRSGGSVGSGGSVTGGD